MDGNNTQIRIVVKKENGVVECLTRVSLVRIGGLARGRPDRIHPPSLPHEAEIGIVGSRDERGDRSGSPC